MGESPPRQYALAGLFSVLPIIAVVLRFWSRFRKKSQLLWDDWTIVFALFSCIATAVLLIVDTAAGGLGTFRVKVDTNGRPMFDHVFYTHMKVIFANRLTQVLAIGPTKISVLLLYRRIFSCRRVFDILSITLLFVAVAWTITFFLTNLLERFPIDVTWTRPPNAYAPTNTMMYLAQCYIDIATDILIISLPIPIIWSLTCKPSKRVGICCVFLLGILTTAASITRTVVQYGIAETYRRIHTNPELVANFNTYYVTPGVYWPLIEAGLGIIAACLPLLRPVQKLFLKATFFGMQAKSLPIARPANYDPEKRGNTEYTAAPRLPEPCVPKLSDGDSWMRIYHDSILNVTVDNESSSGTSSHEEQTQHHSTEELTDLQSECRFGDYRTA